jgi:hypothetical protein
MIKHLLLSILILMFSLGANASTRGVYVFSSEGNPIYVVTDFSEVTTTHSYSVSSANAVPVTFAAGVVEITVDNDSTLAFDDGLVVPIVSDQTYTTSIAGVPYTISSILARSQNNNTSNIYVRVIQRGVL